MINSKILKVTELDDRQKQAMYGLYSQYYAGTSLELFLKDLDDKSHVLLLDEIRGFTTIKIFETFFEGQRVRVIFSGDTIVHHAHWGQHDLAQTWLKLAGQIKQQQPDLPLYWLLIVKGQRTYRYLNVFSYTYYPCVGIETPSKVKKLMDQLAVELFGTAYNADRGILSFKKSQGHLQETWATVPAKDLRHPEVQFFLERNPGYAKGDELVCLCELNEANLKPLSRRFFIDG